MDVFMKLKDRLNVEKKNDEAQTVLWTNDRAGYEDSPDISKLAISEATQLDDIQKKDYPLPQGMAAAYFSGEFIATGAEFATGLGDDRDVNEQVPVGVNQPFSPPGALSALGKLATKDSFSPDKAASGQSGFDSPIPDGFGQSYHDNDAEYRYSEPHVAGSFPQRVVSKQHRNSDSDVSSDSDSDSDKSPRESYEEGQIKYGDSNGYREVVGVGESDSPTGQYLDHPGRDYQQEIDSIQSPESVEEDDGFLDRLQDEGRERIIREIDERLGEAGGDLAEEYFEDDNEE